MRRTIARKILIGFAVILALGAAAMLVTYRGLKRVEREMTGLAEVNEPANSATHEMEINVNGIAIGTLGYLSTPAARFREMVSKDQSDFDRFHAKYVRLASTDRERQFGRQMAQLYQDFERRGEEMMVRRDQQAAAFAAVVQSLEEMDDRIDNQLQAKLDPHRPGDAVKLEALNGVEADIAEVGMWLAEYRRSHQERYKVLISSNVEECRATIRRLNELEDLTADERQAVADLEEAFHRTMDGVGTIMADEDYLRDASGRFVVLRDEMDRLLDEGMQPLAVELLARPRREADAAAALVARSVRWLIPLFLLAAACVGALLLRGITTPLRLLKSGTEAVSRGDLSHRIALDSRDEFADLAEQFNFMVSRLQETLVSKERLEDSQRQLEQTVGALQQEIAERVRSEEERQRLQASLRRAETLSAMGSLVAGVAHQVRNPLFGITSVVDAMEARLGERQEYRPYTAVLKEQAGRLSKLMHELMEYGRPAPPDRSPGLIAEVIAEAKRVCQPLADNSLVRLVDDVDDRCPPVVMDRPRLARVFENLIDNAIRHSPPAGRVTVSARPAGGDGRAWVECRVEDGGPGFRDEDFGYVFQPFFHRRRGGTGLGLAIVQRIVEDHGGQVTAGNGAGGGAVMTVRLPAQRP